MNIKSWNKGSEKPSVYLINLEKLVDLSAHIKDLNPENINFSYFI